MSTKSLIINSLKKDSDKKLQKTVTYINPDVSNEKAGQFAQMATALTTSEYKSAAIVKKMDVREEDTGSGTLTIDTTNFTGTAPTVTDIEGGKRLTFDTNGYIDVTY